MDGSVFGAGLSANSVTVASVAARTRSSRAVCKCSVMFLLELWSGTLADRGRMRMKYWDAGALPTQATPYIATISAGSEEEATLLDPVMGLMRRSRKLPE